MEIGTYLVVWFSEGSAKVLDNAENIASLERTVGPYQGPTKSLIGTDPVVKLICVDGAGIYVRGSYIKGYFRSTPEIRETSRQWEKAWKKEDEQDSPSWEG